MCVSVSVCRNNSILFWMCVREMSCENICLLLENVEVDVCYFDSLESVSAKMLEKCVRVLVCVKHLVYKIIHVCV